MPSRNTQLTILLLDSDLGFMLALSHALSERHISAFPAASVEEGERLVSQFQLRLDGAVINCGWPGACEFSEAVKQQNPGAQIVGMATERHRCRQCASLLAATFQDPEDRDPERIGHCADTIQTLLKGSRRRAHRAGNNR